MSGYPQSQIPVKIHLKLKSSQLEVCYASEQFILDSEYLRVMSPSAEVQGHAGQGGKLPTGKKFVRLLKIEPVGHYAVKMVFDDGHDSGLYSWKYLYELCVSREEKWSLYLEKLAGQSASRDPDTQVVNIMQMPDNRS